MDLVYASSADHISRPIVTGTNLHIKQEPMEDSEPERPIDMSLQPQDSFGDDSRRVYHIDVRKTDAGNRQFYTSHSQYVQSHHLHHHQQQQQHQPYFPNNHVHSSNRSPATKPEHYPHRLHADATSMMTTDFPPCVPPSRVMPVSPDRATINNDDSITSPNTSPPAKVKNGGEKLNIPDILTDNGSSYSNFAMIGVATHQRAKREFVPNNRKDESYWSKRVKNNDSARRSRVKRKALEKIMETRLMELQKENIELRHEMAILKSRFGISNDTSITASESDSDAVNSSSPKSISPNIDPMIKNDQDKDLEQQSAGSDDSRSQDDCRSYHIGSSSILNQALGLTSRDRTDSIGSSSGSSVGRGSVSSRPESRGSQACVIDKSGALDLTGSTGDLSNRSTPARDSSPENFLVESKKVSLASEMSTNCTDDIGASGGNSLKAFPLKCRWKRGFHITKSGSTLETEPC